MKGGIIFIGGIHGVGKGMLCSNVASAHNIIHLTASKVLRWRDFATDLTDKCVADIPATQNRLLANLEKIIQPERIYLLDGHFCLFNEEGEIEKVPDETFIGINPMKLVLVTESPEVIGSRLSQRDGKEYDICILKRMKEFEKEHALHISRLLNIRIYEIQSDSYAELEDIVSNRK